jgi:hypothetical protein
MEKGNFKRKYTNMETISVKENNSPLEDSYAITAIPVKILINKDGLIIGRWRGGGEENKIEIVKLLDKEFAK